MLGVFSDVRTRSIKPKRAPAADIRSLAVKQFKSLSSQQTKLIMTDAAAPAVPTPAKKTKKVASKKPKKPSDHPKYSEMIRDGITALKERGGSSRQALLKYIVKSFKVGSDEKAVNSHLKLALRAGVKNGSLKQSKGSGASGSFRLGEKAEKKAKKPKAKKATKPKAAKPKSAKPKAAKKSTPKKAAAKKPKAAKKSPKKAAKPKAAKKSPAKKAAKPKKTKSPKKKAAAKK